MTMANSNKCTFALAGALFCVALHVCGPEGSCAPPETVSFPTEDGGLIYADLYGSGDKGVVLAHGARFNKESWEKQAQELAKAGYRALAIDFRGYGKSRGPDKAQTSDAPRHLDVLGAVRYLRKAGAKSVAVIGGSMGGVAAGMAAAEAKAGEIDRVVLLGSDGGKKPGQMKGRKLFVTSRDDPAPGLARVRENFDKAADPKELLVLDGSAHAQFIFTSDQGERLMREILRFLAAP